MKKLLIVGAATAALAPVRQLRNAVISRAARTEIPDSVADPLAQQAAGSDLDAARKSLQQAELRSCSRAKLTCVAGRTGGWALSDSRRSRVDG